MKRPKINLPNEPIDHLLDVLGFLGVASMIGIVGYYYGELPEEVPTHFNAKGETDAWGDKSSIWMMPVIGGVLFLVLFFINKKPHLFNYPTKITEDNAALQYRKATRMMRYVNTVTVFFFMYITWRSIQTAFGNGEGLGRGLLVVIFIGVAGLLGYMGGTMEK